MITLGSGSGQQMGDGVSYSTKLLHLPLNYLGTMRWKHGKSIGWAMHSSVLAVVSKTRDTVHMMHNRKYHILVFLKFWFAYPSFLYIIMNNTFVMIVDGLVWHACYS